MKEDVAILYREFVESEALRGRREQGLRGNLYRVRQFIAYLDEQELALSELRVRHATTYQGHLLSKKYRVNTVLALLGSAQSFMAFLRKSGRIAMNPFTQMRRVRAEKRVVRGILKEHEMDSLLAKLACFHQVKNLKQRITAYRVHVVAELMYATGMRVSEVAALTLDDVELSRSMVKVSQGKGGIARYAYLNEYAREILRLYVDRVRPHVFSEWNHVNEELLFGVRWGWFGKIVNREVSHAAKELELPRFSSHGFRHALGYHLLRAGCSIRHIQQILGHKRLKNTEIYTQVDKEDLKEVLDKCHPRTKRGSVLDGARVDVASGLVRGRSHAERWAG